MVMGLDELTDLVEEAFRYADTDYDMREAQLWAGVLHHRRSQGGDRRGPARSSRWGLRVADGREAGGLVYRMDGAAGERLMGGSAASLAALDFGEK